MEREHKINYISASLYTYRGFYIEKLSRGWKLFEIEKPRTSANLMTQRTLAQAQYAIDLAIDQPFGFVRSSK